MMQWAQTDVDQAAVQVTEVSQAALLADLQTRLKARSGFAVATLNLDHVVKLRSDSAFRQAYSAHTHVSADGWPIVMLSRLSGRPVDLVTGSDLVDPLLSMVANLRTPVALLGATDAVLASAAQRLTDQHAGLQIVAQIAPPMGFDPQSAQADTLIAALAASGAQLCLLALGAPKQELFAAHAAAQLPYMGFVSIGAGLDFVAGTQRRAPRIMRTLKAEWLWRLLSNPQRLAGRYAVCLGVLPGLFVRALRSRLTHTSGAIR
jgi:N-acetylglucosaminyldiphosphoundecaprenol N-acetyl-beta-D-mannosaminyltransferase